MATFVRWAPLALIWLLAGCRAGSAYEAPRVTPQAAHARIVKGETVVIADVRSPALFRKEHAAGAINLPFATLKLQTKLPVPKDQTILLYCT